MWSVFLCRCVDGSNLWVDKQRELDHGEQYSLFWFDERISLYMGAGWSCDPLWHFDNFPGSLFLPV